MPRRRSPRFPDSIEFTDEVVNVWRHLDFASRNMLINPHFSGLPVRGPEPCLVRWDRQLWTQLDYSILALKHLDLRTGPVKSMSTTHLRWQHDLAAGAHTYERSLIHNSSSIAGLPQSGIAGQETFEVLAARCGL
jgi:hypothetical protein